MFKEVYAMEKIHGTSTWITFKFGRKMAFHSGGENYENFKALFDETLLETNLSKIASENNWVSIKIHGEAYGGKQQRMSKTYGTKLKFIVFDIFVTSTDKQIPAKYLDVPDAEKLALELGLEFVSYVKGSNTPVWIEEQSAVESIQAIRNGAGSGKLREGVVVRPITEALFPDSKRAIAKHKNAEFWEITTRRPLGERAKVIAETNQIVDEWVTENRVNHVIDRVLQSKEKKELEISDIKNFLELMVEDVKRESEGEVVWADAVTKGIRRKAGKMFKAHNSKKIENIID